jgi:hypothetical protein
MYTRGVYSIKKAFQQLTIIATKHQSSPLFNLLNRMHNWLIHWRTDFCMQVDRSNNTAQIMFSIVNQNACF